MRGERRFGIKRRWGREGGELVREVVSKERRAVNGSAGEGGREW